jgi:hypothetical protein
MRQLQPRSEVEKHQTSLALVESTTVSSLGGRMQKKGVYFFFFLAFATFGVSAGLADAA